MAISQMCQSKPNMNPHWTALRIGVTAMLFCYLINLAVSSLSLPTFAEFDINSEDFSIDSMEVTSPEEEPQNVALGVADSVIKAVAVLRGPKTHGIVQLVQIGSGPTHISGTVSGLFPLSNHGFHVHQHRVVGDCESAGEHYNPTMQNHGAPYSPMSHVGDLGNLQANAQGIAQFEIINEKVSLRGKFSVIQRSLVVHLRPDDLGMGYNRESLQSGNSGSRIACGTITFVSINNKE